jgi:hypothetical protein
MIIQGDLPKVTSLWRGFSNRDAHRFSEHGSQLRFCEIFAFSERGRVLACKGFENLKRAIGEFSEQVKKSTPEYFRIPVSNGFL